MSSFSSTNQTNDPPDPSRPVSQSHACSDKPFLSDTALLTARLSSELSVLLSQVSLIQPDSTQLGLHGLLSAAFAETLQAQETSNFSFSQVESFLFSACSVAAPTFLYPKVSMCYDLAVGISRFKNTSVHTKDTPPPV